jgi:hypothetical protein
MMDRMLSVVRMAGMGGGDPLFEFHDPESPLSLSRSLDRIGTYCLGKSRFHDKPH